jgi:hypothetical protein
LLARTMVPSLLRDTGQDRYHSTYHDFFLLPDACHCRTLPAKMQKAPDKSGACRRVLRIAALACQTADHSHSNINDIRKSLITRRLPIFTNVRTSENTST